MSAIERTLARLNVFSALQVGLLTADEAERILGYLDAAAARAS